MRLMGMHGALMGIIVVGLLATGCGASLDIDIGGDTKDGSGDPVTTTFEVDDFDRIEASHSFTVDVVVGSGGPSVEVESDDNLVEDLEVRVSGDTLELGMESGSYRPTILKAVVVVEDLRFVEASGASGLVVEGVAGSPFDVRASGASTVTVDGEAADVDVEASGASEVDLGDLEAEVVTVDSSGASTVELWATQEVSGDASGASSVVVSGGASVDVDTSGASSVEID